MDGELPAQTWARQKRERVQYESWVGMADAISRPNEQGHATM